MESFEYFLLTVDNSSYTYRLPPNKPLQLNSNAQIGLKSYFMFYTFPNISTKYFNNEMKVSIGGRERIITIPTGMYDLEALDEIISEKTGGNIRLSANLSTFQTVMTLSGATVDFSHGKLHEILGFKPQQYTESATSEDIINITRGVDRILIRSNLVDRPYQPAFRDVLYDILPVGNPGAAIQENLELVEYHSCRDSVIREIEIRITDQHNNLIALSEPLTLKILFKY